MKSIILAAGFATRLYPLTQNQAKPLLEIAGRELLSHIVDRVLGLDGLDEIVVVCNGKFYADFVAWKESYVPGPNAASSRLVPITLIDDGALDDDTKLGGVADMALGFQKGQEASSWLVLAGDNLLEFDLDPYRQKLVENGHSIILARDLGPNVPKKRYGEIVADASGRVVSFREKPEDPRSSWAATCIYFFTEDIPSLVEQYLKEGGERDTPGSLIAWLVDRTRIDAMPLGGPCRDIGTMESLEAVRALYGSESAGG